MPDTIQLVTVGEAAAELGLSHVMVRRLAKSRAATGRVQGGVAVADSGARNVSGQTQARASGHGRESSGRREADGES